METRETSIAVVYEDGVFKPQEPVPARLRPHQVLRLRLPDEDETEGDARAVGESWKDIEELIGIIDDKDAATDMSTNHDRYLYGDLRPR